MDKFMEEDFFTAEDLTDVVEETGDVEAPETEPGTEPEGTEEPTGDGSGQDQTGDGDGGEPSGGDPLSTGEVEGGFSPEMMERINAETQRRVDAAIAQQFEGVVNPYTKQPIRTEADLNAYRKAFEADQQRMRLQEMGVDKEMLDSYIQNHPAMLEAQQVIRQQEQREANSFMGNEFKALKKEFPDCGFDSPQALYATEAGKKALQMWANTPGVTLADAYAATHRTEISKRQSAAAKQAAMNQMNSKNHLTQTKGGNAKGEVPADIYAEYKAFFPEASASEIAEMYRKNHQND